MVPAGIAASGKAAPLQLRSTLLRMSMPAQRPAEVLGTPTHAQLTICTNRHCAPLLGIGSGHRQLIAVTCIAEHA